MDIMMTEIFRGVKKKKKKKNKRNRKEDKDFIEYR